MPVSTRAQRAARPHGDHQRIGLLEPALQLRSASLGNADGTMREEVIFEECRGIGHSFAFNRAEGYDVYDTRDESVRRLIETVGRGGNLLLDIGPTADGRIPLIIGRGSPSVRV